MQGIIKAGSKKEEYIEENCFITELINTDAFAGCSVSKARVLPGSCTENHVVKDTDEIYYILSGSGEMEIDGHPAGIASTGDVVFIPRNTSQRITNTGAVDLVFLCICTPRFEFKNYSGI